MPRKSGPTEEIDVVGAKIVTSRARPGRDSMAERILRVFRREGVQCFGERHSLDVERFVDYQDSDEHPAEDLFETPALELGRKRISEVGSNIPPIVTYFLDGSRRTYKVADAIVNGRYLPVIAGQIGVAVLERSGTARGLSPLREFCRLKNVIALPLPHEDVAYLQKAVRDSGNNFELFKYELKPDSDPVDLGVAKVMSEMHALEVSVVREMADRHLLRSDRVLVVDGPLRFKKQFDVVQFRNVVGVSKTFRPTFVVGKGKRKTDVGSITARLAFGERTSVFRTQEEQKILGMWYLRLRPPAMMNNPLQGVVKLETYAVEREEVENGLQSDRVDVLSAHILRERNVTPFKADQRWASHLYPIYLAESYLKASFASDVSFNALF